MINIDEYLAYKKKRKSKIVIYTAISDSFDDLFSHTYITKDFDYVCFTNTTIESPGIWEIRPLENRGFDSNRNAKYYKLFPNKFFPEYEYSIYIDGNIDVLDSALEAKVLELIHNGVILSSNYHFERDCIYDEAKICMMYNIDDINIIEKQIKMLQDNGFPHNYGLFEMNLIFRKHHDEKVKKIMMDWWDIIKKNSKRDQLSFMYVLWKNNIQCTPMFSVNPRKLNNSFKYYKHNKIIASVLFIDYGNGYNIKDVVVARNVIKHDGSFSVLFKIGRCEKNIHSLRFDPIEGQPCKCKIENVDTDGVYVGIKYKNSTEHKNGYDIFYTTDPIYVFDGDFSKTTYIKISGKLEILDYSFLAEKPESTRSELNRIINSNKYRIAVKLEKIARKTGLIYLLKFLLKIYGWFKNN